MSAKDLSNWLESQKATLHPHRQLDLLAPRGENTHLLQHLHSQLRGYRTARDEFVQRVRQSHADPIQRPVQQPRCWCQVPRNEHTMNRGKTHSMLTPSSVYKKELVNVEQSNEGEGGGRF